MFNAAGDIRLDDAYAPQIREPTDAIVRLTSSAICGADLHFVRGTVSGMKPGRILGYGGEGGVGAFSSRLREFLRENVARSAG